MNVSVQRLREMPMPDFSRVYRRAEPVLLFFILLMVWIYGPGYLRFADGTAGAVDQSILLLILLSIMVFLFVLGLCWWLMLRFTQMVGLPSINNLVSKFYFLELWQQYAFYWLSFALLVLGSLMAIMAIC